MATITTLSSLYTPTRLSYSKLCLFKRYNNTTSLFNRSFSVKLRASSTAFVEVKPTDRVVAEKEVATGTKDILACPICFEPVTLIGDHVLSVDSASGSSLRCSSCNKTYSGTDGHLELVVASGAKEFGEAMPIATEMFRLPLISFLYERGWRQNFIWGGFPGLEREFEMMKEYLKPVLGGNIVDASCGSGLFSRHFAKSGLFSFVVALDYSESMLKQCYEFVKQEEGFPKESLILVRADIGRLPFLSCSVDAVHAGAAIHCWPSPSTALAEISRVLKPGGVFVGSTYILDGPFSLVPFLRPINQMIMQVSGSQMFLSDRELEAICKTCGLVDFTCVRNGRFVMFTAKKPN